MPSRTVEMTATFRALPRKENMGGLRFEGRGPRSPLYGVRAGERAGARRRLLLGKARARLAPLSTNTRARAWLRARSPKPLRRASLPAVRAERSDHELR